MKKFSPLAIPRRQAGVSLVEVLLVLGVIAMLMIAAFILYPQVKGGQKAYFMANQWQEILHVLPEEADPLVLEKNMNRELLSSVGDGAQWHLESDGRGKWLSTLTLQSQGKQACARVGEAMLGLPGEPSANGKPISTEIMQRACKEQAPVQFSLAAIPGMLPEPLAASEGLEVDIYSSRRPAKSDQWNQAGGF